MKSLPLYDEDLSSLSADELSDEIEELQRLRASPGWKILRRLLYSLYVKQRDLLVDASPLTDRTGIALLQGRATALREISGEINSKFDDDASNSTKSVIDKMIEARREAYRASEDRRAQFDRMHEANPELTWGEWMAATYPNEYAGNRDFDGSGADLSLYATEAGVGHVIVNDSVPGSERGGRLEV